MICSQNESQDSPWLSVTKSLGNDDDGGDDGDNNNDNENEEYDENKFCKLFFY